MPPIGLARVSQILVLVSTGETETIAQRQGLAAALLYTLACHLVKLGFRPATTYLCLNNQSLHKLMYSRPLSLAVRAAAPGPLPCLRGRSFSKLWPVRCRCRCVGQAVPGQGPEDPHRLALQHQRATPTCRWCNTNVQHQRAGGVAVLERLELLLFLDRGGVARVYIHRVLPCARCRSPSSSRSPLSPAGSSDPDGHPSQLFGEGCPCATV
eukprot:SAG25_NODE_110_length_15015_cov_29.036270_1_plen_211_part_00